MRVPYGYTERSSIRRMNRAHSERRQNLRSITIRFHFGHCSGILHCVAVLTTM